MLPVGEFRRLLLVKASIKNSYDPRNHTKGTRINTNKTTAWLLDPARVWHRSRDATPGAAEGARMITAGRLLNFNIDLHHPDP
jgi:hypothetical protein